MHVIVTVQFAGQLRSHHGASSCQASSKRRALSRFSGFNASDVLPHATGWRASSSVSGKCSRTRLRSWATTMIVRLSPCQRLISAIRSTTVLESMALNGSSSRMISASCTSTRANSARCNWPPDSVSIGRFSNPSRPTADNALEIDARSSSVNRPSRPRRGQTPSDDEIDDARGKRAVELGLLRQIGDACSRRVDDLAVHRLQHAGDALHERRLAGAIGADHRRQRPGRDRAGEMMDGGMPAVSQRQIVEGQTGLRHCAASLKGHGNSVVVT